MIIVVYKRHSSLLTQQIHTTPFNAASSSHTSCKYTHWMITYFISTCTLSFSWYGYERRGIVVNVISVNKQFVIQWKRSYCPWTRASASRFLDNYGTVPYCHDSVLHITKNTMLDNLSSKTQEKGHFHTCDSWAYTLQIAVACCKHNLGHRSEVHSKSQYYW